MASAAIEQARRLVIASMQAQALHAGLWQQYRGMQWWQSGLPAVAANLVVDCAPSVSAGHLCALARLMARWRTPAGWLVWPDQAPERQVPWLQTCGLFCCERIWLASVAAEDLRSNEPAASCRVLGVSDRSALMALFQSCHAVPAAFAAVVAAAFTHQQPLSLAQGTVQLQTFAACRAADALNPITTSITAVLWVPSGHGAAEQACGALVWLGTHPAWRRRGYARQVTASACHWLQASGAQRLFVQASAAAAPLYRDLGFAEDGWLQLWRTSRG